MHWSVSRRLSVWKKNVDGDTTTMDMNKRILKKIRESNTDNQTKEFIREIFLLELEHFGSLWKHGKDYERLIKKYTADWEGEK